MTLSLEVIECDGCAGEMSVCEIWHFDQKRQRLYCCEWCEVVNVLIPQWRIDAAKEIRRAIKECTS